MDLRPILLKRKKNMNSSRFCEIKIDAYEEEKGFVFLLVYSSLNPIKRGSLQGINIKQKNSTPSFFSMFILLELCEIQRVGYCLSFELHKESKDSESPSL